MMSALKHLRALLCGCYVVLSLSGCVSSLDLVGDEVAPLTNEPHFPDGKYLHAVTLAIPGHGEWNLQGVMKLTETSIHLLGLSPMGTTVFQIEDDFSKSAPQIQVFQPELEKHQDKVLAFYEKLRPYLIGSRKGALANQTANEPKLSEDASEIFSGDVSVKYYPNRKQSDLPPTIYVRSKRFALLVEVERYEH